MSASYATKQASDRASILVTVEEAMSLMRLSRPSFYALIKSRQIKTVRFGRARRVPIAEIERLSRADFVPLDGAPLRRRRTVA